jgi:hypothetical protein
VEKATLMKIGEREIEERSRSFMDLIILISPLPVQLFDYTKDNRL